MESESLREKIPAHYHDRNPLTLWQDSEHLFYLVSVDSSNTSSGYLAGLIVGHSSVGILNTKSVMLSW